MPLVVAGRVPHVRRRAGGRDLPVRGARSHFIVYFDTDDIDAMIVRIHALGGEAAEKSPIPGVGWFARCKDTEGNAFSLFQPDETVPVPS